MTEKVISFPGAVEPLPENLVTNDTPEKHRYNYCAHDAISLDEHQRVVNCVKCGAVLDPFNFLRDNARTLQRAWDNHRQANSKVSEIMDRIGILERERKRLSGQVKRLQEKAAPIIDVRGRDKL